MKISLFFIIFALFINCNWINELDTSIEKINKQAILRNEKSIKNDNEQSVWKIYKFKDYNKIELNGTGKFMDTFSYQFYANKKFVFATSDFIIADYFHKGVNYSGRAKGEITENKFYYKNEKEGMKLTRTIDYYENSNLDSLILALQKKNFDTAQIGNDEYLLTKRSFKKISKRI